MEKIYSHHENGQTKSLYVKTVKEPISSCQIYNEKKMMLTGISLGNSYFNEDRLRVILSGFSSQFEKVAVLLVDDLAIHNYRARGYEEKRAKRKIKEDSNHTRNRIKKVIGEVEEKLGRNNIQFYQWKDIELFSQYHQSLEVITEYYKNDDEFAQEINQATLHVMDNYISAAQTKDSVLNEAKWYLLKEFAFINCASHFFESSLVSGYYADFPIFRNRLLPKIMKEPDQLCFVIYECREES